jgi:hypothetical protein
VTARRFPPVLAAAKLSDGGGFKAGALPPIHSAETKHGFRRTWGRYEFAQVAIALIYPDGLPLDIDKAELVRDVNELLAADPTYRATRLPPITRNTVLAAAGLLDRPPSRRRLSDSQNDR